MTSQFREDKYIETVFDEVGYGSRVLCDFGARLEYSNSSELILKHGFTGTLVDCDGEACNKLRSALPAANVVNAAVTPQNVNDLVPANCWFLSIDIDSYDWFVWAALVQRPALVVVETNPLPGLFAAKASAGRKDPEGYGMSVRGAIALGELKGYTYIGRTEVNAFFVRSELGCKFRLPEIKSHGGLPCRSTNNILHEAK